MSSHELQWFPDAGSLAQAVADRWMDELRRRAAAPNPCCVALAGGRITRQFYAAVVEISLAQSRPLDDIHFFWGDERCVPPAHAESNFAAANELLFKPLGIAQEQIHRVQGEAPEEAAISQAEAEICRIAPINDDGQPVLDLVFLGMGEDGHVASLFPEEAEIMMSDRAVYRGVTATKPPPQRITLGYRALAAARQVWVLASGKGKEAALGNSLDPNGKTPLARLLQMRERTAIFTDIKPG